MTHTYEVHDTIENKHFICKSRQEVHDKIGICANMVAKYVLNHWHYKNRYYITEAYSKPKVMDFKPGTREVMKQFDNAMIALKKNYTKEYLSSLKFKCAG